MTKYNILLKYKYKHTNRVKWNMKSSYKIIII